MDNVKQGGYHEQIETLDGLVFPDSFDEIVTQGCMERDKDDESPDGGSDDAERYIMKSDDLSPPLESPKED